MPPSLSETTSQAGLKSNTGCAGQTVPPASSTQNRVFERPHLKKATSKEMTPHGLTLVSKKNVLTREKIARSIADLLGLPKVGCKGKAFEVANTVIRAMTLALLKGESVKIDGFGIFTIYERPATRSPAYFYPRLGKGQHWELLSLPPTRRVIFKPSKPLLRLLNHAD